MNVTYVDGKREQQFVLSQCAKSDIEIIFHGLKGLVREKPWGFELISPFQVIGIGQFRTLGRQEDGTVVLA